MSRRRGEFEHRTSIFEGAYRAWSHLGGVDPTDLGSPSATAADLDPLSTPHEDDKRIPESDRDKATNVVIDSCGKKRLFPYEPLPRSGLSHPFIQAIISPWLGPDAEHDDIILGLTTLRTWWQHRRKGESTSAKSALGTDKMKSVVEGYTRHFFNLAHCIVMNDGEQPPRTLSSKIKDLERNGFKLAAMKKNAIAVAITSIPPKDKQILESSSTDAMDAEGGTPEKTGEDGGSQSCCGGSKDHNANMAATRRIQDENKSYGDRTKTPVVFVSDKGDIQIAMGITGISCGNCVKIIETVLKGINGSPSPIKGIMDAAADRELSMVIIKISKSSFAKRIAFEATENLKMVGYDAKANEMGIVDPNSGASMDLNALRTAFDIVAATDAKDVFDWKMKCLCPDNGILRADCGRHSQMNKRIFEAFDLRQEQIKEFMGGCGKKYGLQCTCGDKCKCNSGKCCGPGATRNIISASVRTSPVESMQTNVTPPPQAPPVSAMYAPQAPAYSIHGARSLPPPPPPVTQISSNAAMIPQVQHNHDPHARANHFYHHQQSQAMAQHRQQPLAMVQHPHPQPQPSMTQISSVQQPNMPQHMTQAAMDMPRYNNSSMSGPVVGNYINGQFIPNMMYRNQQQQQHNNVQQVPSNPGCGQAYWKP